MDDNSIVVFIIRFLFLLFFGNWLRKRYEYRFNPIMDLIMDRFIVRSLRKTSSLIIKEKILVVYVIIGVVVFLSRPLLYDFYMNTVHSVRFSEGILSNLVKSFGPPFGIFLIIAYFVFLLIGKRRGIVVKVISFSIGLAFLFLLFLQKQTAEGYDMFLFFSLACISGFIGYHKTIGFNTITRFLSALFAWLTIIALNEVIQCFFPNSEAIFPNQPERCRQVL